MISSVGLRYFAEVTRCGSFRGAASHLFVAASAISRQIGLLEEALGAPLFERGRGRTPLRLTAAGELLMHYAQKQHNELEQVRSAIEALKGLRRGHVRFGIPETFTREFVPEFLVRFSRRFPAITYQVEVAGSPRLVELVAGDALDLALTFNPPPALNVRHVFERQMTTHLLVAHDHPLARRRWVTLADCAEYGLAMPGPSISAKRLYDEMFAHAKIRPRVVLESNSYELLRTVSQAGLSIAIVNAQPGRPLARTGRWRYVPFRDPRVKPQRFTLCVRHGRNLPAAAVAFSEHLQRELAAMKEPR